MKRLTFLPFAALLLTAWIANPAFSQQQNAPSTGQPKQESWYPQESIKPKKTIPQQKAEYRGRQRTMRLEALRRQGISIARPTVYGLPFTNTQRPHGRHYYGRRQVIVIYR